MREILQPPLTPYSEDMGACRSHWTKEGRARETDASTIDVLLCSTIPRTERPPASIAAPQSAEEIGRRLYRANNTAPGSDRLENRHLCQLDQQARLLTPILNGCLRLGRVPPSWRSGTTILIHKKWDPSDPGNFRPITLLPTMCKLLAGCLAARLSKWAQAYGEISAQQKGFVPGVEGCLEQSFMVGAAFEEASDTTVRKGGTPYTVPS